MLSSLFINWNPDPEWFHIGPVPIRYYGLLWVIGIALGYLVVRYLYRDKKLGDDKFEPLFFYVFFGILIGARLGHCIFYDYNLHFHSWTGFIEIFIPFGHNATGWHWTGYAGLASHGGTIGLMIALWLYCRKTKMHYMDVLDMIAIATPICACCIRLANLINSEIVGKVTNVPWAFVFERLQYERGVIDPLSPRHPAQLYEAIAYFAFFLLMIYLYKHYGKTVRRGFFFGLCLTEIFTFRFFVEFLKENQVDFEKSMTLNMGQWLSIPFILIGLYCIFFYGKKALAAK